MAAATRSSRPAKMAGLFSAKVTIRWRTRPGVMRCTTPHRRLSLWQDTGRCQGLPKDGDGPPTDVDRHRAAHNQRQSHGNPHGGVVDGEARAAEGVAVVVDQQRVHVSLGQQRACSVDVWLQQALRQGAGEHDPDGLAPLEAALVVHTTADRQRRMCRDCHGRAGHKGMSEASTSLAGQNSPHPQVIALPVGDVARAAADPAPWGWRSKGETDVKRCQRTSKDVYKPACLSHCRPGVTA